MLLGFMPFQTHNCTDNRVQTKGNRTRGDFIDTNQWEKSYNFNNINKLA